MEPHELILSVTNAGVAARCLHVVAELGVADHIDDRPVPAKELARLCAVDPDGLDRVLRLLAAHGVFSLRRRRVPAQRRVPAAARRPPHVDARLPPDDGPAGGAEVLRRAGLFGAHRSPSIELSDPGGLWGYLSGAPAEQAVFGRAMTGRAAGDTAAVLAAHDFSVQSPDRRRRRWPRPPAARRTRVDPPARGILFDLPEVVEAGGPAHPRLVRQAGDFFVDPLPAGDTYLVMEVLHDWADAEAVAILTAIRRAATDDATVLIIEGILPEHLDPRSLTIDVIMLAVTGGRERTAGELAELLNAAGLQLTQVIDTAGRLRIAEAVPARALTRQGQEHQEKQRRST